MFSKGSRFAREVERIKENLKIDNESYKNNILIDIIETIREFEDAIEILQNIVRDNDLFEVYTTQQVGRLIYLIAFEEDENNPIRNRLLNGEELLGEDWYTPGVIRQHLLDLTRYMHQNDLNTVSQDELAKIFVHDVEAAKYILNNCRVLDKDSQGKYSFKSEEFRMYMNENLTLNATAKLTKKYQ